MLIGAVGDERLLDQELLQSLPGVEQALSIVKPYKIVAREWHPEDTVRTDQRHSVMEIIFKLYLGLVRLKHQNR